MSSAPFVAGIGELLWDRFPDEDRLGGAPANFAFHALQLGAKSRIISRIGRDDDGERMIDFLSQKGIEDELIQQDPNRKTGTVLVNLHEGQPSYTIEFPVAWDFIESTPALDETARRLNGICFGTLAQRHEVARRMIQHFIGLCNPMCIRLFDINLRQHYYTRETIEFGLQHCSVLKINADELRTISLLFGWDQNVSASVGRIFELYPLEYLAITKGEKGCEIHTREVVIQSSAPPIACIDAVGAGDAFAASLIIGLLAKRPLQAIADQSNRIGAFVASQQGAMPKFPTQLLI